MRFNKSLIDVTNRYLNEISFIFGLNNTAILKKLVIQPNS